MNPFDEIARASCPRSGDSSCWEVYSGTLPLISGKGGKRGNSNYEVFRIFALA